MAAFVHRVLFSLVILAVYSFMVDGDDIKDETKDRGAHSDRGGVWFGPRLGKRSLRLSDDNSKTSLLRLLEAADTLKYYYDRLPYDMQADISNDKEVYTQKSGRAAIDDVEFTPRLGRKVSQAMPSTSSAEEMYRQDPILVDTRPNHFSPRLGRNYNFSPRLGRELTYELFPYVRLARSINDSKTT